MGAASGDSGDKSRDKKMNTDVLDAPHFADVTFVPQSYQGTIAPQAIQPSRFQESLRCTARRMT